MKRFFFNFITKKRKSKNSIQKINEIYPNGNSPRNDYIIFYFPFLRCTLIFETMFIELKRT